MTDESIYEVKDKNDIKKCFSIMKQLRSHLDEETFVELVREAQEKERYELHALKREGEIIALVGFKPMITLYYGKFVWVCDLVTDEQERSKGYGKRLLDFVHHWSFQHQYESLALSSGLEKRDAHRFYSDRMEYNKVSYVFRKML